MVLQLSLPEAPAQFSPQPLASVNQQHQRKDLGHLIFPFLIFKSHCWCWLLILAAHTHAACCPYCWSPCPRFCCDPRCICWPRPERWLQPHCSSSVRAERWSAQVKCFTLLCTEHFSQFAVWIVSIYLFFSFRVAASLAGEPAKAAFIFPEWLEWAKLINAVISSPVCSADVASQHRGCFVSWTWLYYHFQHVGSRWLNGSSQVVVLVNNLIALSSSDSRASRGHGASRRASRRAGV